ncbi:hypothetical protein EDC01DRAFT_636745 [Geopyxis carbonaria]|nr:hypothetical protein EDC01DRAFT_636745 [Geopyxis carbonaria]
MSGRTNSNGGIQKRTGGPRPRTDRDGDLEMDPSGARGRGGRNRKKGRGGRGGGGGNGGSGGTGGGSGPRNPLRDPVGTKGSTKGSKGAPKTSGGLSMVPVQVVGWKNSKGSSEECVQFLERKTHINIKKTQKHGDVLLVYVPAKLVEALLDWDNVLFCGANLKISSQLNDAVMKSVTTKLATEGGGSSNPDEVKDRLKRVLENRYNPQMKLLSLANLGQDPILRETGIFELGTTKSKLFPVLMVIADNKFINLQKKRESVVSISLAENGISNLTAVAELARTFPDIKNLDLSRNNIPNLKALERWKGKFRLLEILLLEGNPIQAEPGYREEIIRWFPNLQSLDSVPVSRPAVYDQPSAPAAIVQRPSTAVDAKGQAILPLPVKEGFIDPTCHAITMSFLAAFFSMYDTSREELLRTYYDDQSQFSLNVNTSAPRVKEQTGVRQYWDVYIPESRNLKRVDPSGQNAINRNHQGLASIFELWKKLPETRHNLSEVHLWNFDVFPGPNNTILAIIHSEFDENNPVGGVMKRSFDRSFLLRPQGNSVKVVSDLLTIRSYAGAEAWKEQPPAVAVNGTNVQSLPTNTPVAAPISGPIVDGLSDVDKLERCRMLCKETGLKLSWSQQCLSESNWDLSTAWTKFITAKQNGALGPEAFEGGSAPMLNNFATGDVEL